MDCQQSHPSYTSLETANSSVEVTKSKAIVEHPGSCSGTSPLGRDKGFTEVFTYAVYSGDGGGSNPNSRGWVRQ